MRHLFVSAKTLYPPLYNTSLPTRRARLQDLDRNTVARYAASVTPKPTMELGVLVVDEDWTVIDVDSLDLF